MRPPQPYATQVPLRRVPDVPTRVTRARGSGHAAPRRSATCSQRPQRAAQPIVDLAGAVRDSGDESGNAVDPLPEHVVVRLVALHPLRHEGTGNRGDWARGHRGRVGLLGQAKVLAQELELVGQVV